jgi:hypothetical protein
MAANSGINCSPWLTTWEKLASERSDLIRRHPELAIEG